MKATTLITAIAAVFSLVASHTAQAQGAAAGKAAGKALSFLSRVIKRGGSVADDAARAGARTARSKSVIRAIKLPAKLLLRSFVGKDNATGLEYHKNTENGLNVYSPSGELVCVLQPHMFGGFDVYDPNGYFLQRINEGN